MLKAEIFQMKKNNTDSINGKRTELEILYEDNHLIIVNKRVSDLVQKDQTGDEALDDILKKYLKEKYNKPGNVFIGIPHRLDRPVSGVVVFTKTGKALSRMTEMFKNKDIKKTYWAVVKNEPPQHEDLLVHHLVRNTRQNKSHAYNSKRRNSKEAQLKYKILAKSDKYYLLEIELITGRHHQIRSQLSKIECPIRSDLKYGYPRSSKNGGIFLHARNISFEHPIKKTELDISASVPDDPLWRAFEDMVEMN